MSDSKQIKIQGLNFLVTGGNGLVGRRLCEMLIENGAANVVAFDISPYTLSMNDRKGNVDDKFKYENIIEYIGDLTNKQQLTAACTVLENNNNNNNNNNNIRIDCIFHIAAVVGPYHAYEKYMQVNYHGTLNVIDVCKDLGIGKIVMSSSPSTRMAPNGEIAGLRDDDMEIRKPGDFVQIYAETKAYGMYIYYTWIHTYIYTSIHTYTKHNIKLTIYIHTYLHRYIHQYIHTCMHT